MDDHRTVVVELPEEPQCPDCGTRGAHYCVGKNGSGFGTTYVGRRKDADQKDQ